MKQYDVIGIGSPLMDFLLKADESLLKELSLEKGKMHLIDKESSQKILSKITVSKTSPGGSTANTIAGIALLGGTAVFCGKIGSDSYGEEFSRMTKEEGALPDVKKEEGKITGHAITFITPDNERTFATHLGASTMLKKDDISKEKVSESKILHVEGYQLEDPSLKEASLDAMDAAKNSNTLVSVDLADPNLVKRNLESLKSIVSNKVDIVFANIEEASAFTGKENPEECAAEIGGMCKIALVKTGASGSIAFTEGKSHSIPAFKTDAVDTTGAGDIYASGVLWGIANNIPIEKACALGSMLASKVVSGIGARLTQNQVEEIKKSLSL